jgi:hypothetical protein
VSLGQKPDDWIFTTMKTLKYLSFITLLFGSILSSAQPWQQQTKLVASDRDDKDRFGFALDITDEFAIVGAFWEAHDKNGMNELEKAGSVYIYKNTNGTWEQSQKVVASDRAERDYFGYAVAISDEYAFVGAMWQDEDANGSNIVPNAGMVYVLRNTNGIWSEVQKIVSSDRLEGDYFGRSVSVSGDYLVVGAYGVDKDVQGENHLNSAGAVYVFKNENGTWKEKQKLVASDRGKGDNFGEIVRIEGNQFIVGAPAKDVEGMDIKYDVGAAYVFENKNGTWSEVQKIMASDANGDDKFGKCVTLEGNWIVVGAFQEDEDASGMDKKNAAGSAYVFANNNGTWAEKQKLVALDRTADDNFGVSVALSNKNLFIGASEDAQDSAGLNPLRRAGSMYVFKEDNGTWEQTQKRTAQDREEDAQFGYSLAASENYVLVSAWRSNTDATGSDEKDEPGAAYVFNKKAIVSTQSITAKKISLSPNPFNNSLLVNVPETINEELVVKVKTLNGQEVFNQTLNGVGIYHLDMSHLNSGLYVMQLNGVNTNQVVRIVKN